MPLCPKCQFRWVSTIRSNPQNAYYWGVIIEMLSEELGLEKENVHELLKHQFLKYSFEVQDKLYESTKSTTQLTTIEFEKYLADVRRWSVMELNIQIPEPNEKNL